MSPPSPGKALLLARPEPKRLYAASFAGTARFATPVGGGEPGLSGGWGSVMLARVRAPIVTISYPWSRIDMPGGTALPPPAGTRGWMHVLGPGSGYGNRNWGQAQSDGAWVYAGAAGTGIQLSDVGKLIVMITQHTGTSARILYEREFGPAVTITGLLDAPSAAMVIGNDASGANPALTLDILELASWGGTPTDANLLALADSIRTNGRIPTSPTGITYRHRWSVPQTIGGAKVNPGDAAPALPDLVTGAAADLASPAGVGPTLEIIYPGRDGRTNYGLGGAYLNGWLGTSTAGYPGTTAGFHVIGVIVLGSLAMASGTQMVINNCYTTGWWVRIVNGLLEFGVVDGAGSTTTSKYTLVASDLHLPLWYAGQLTSTGVIRLFVRGAQVGSDVSISGAFAPSNSSPIGVNYWHSGNQQPLSGHFMGATIGADATIAEITQSYKDYQTTGMVQPIAGKVAHLYQPTLDVVAAGGRGALSVTQINDRRGSKPLVSVGSQTIDSANGNGLRGLNATYYYTARSSPISQATTNVYVEALIYARSGTTYAKIVGTGIESGGQGWTFGIHENLIYVNIGATKGFSGPITMNALHHVCFTIDSTGFAYLYVDGSAVVASNSMALAPDTTTGALQIYGAAPTTVIGVGVATTLPTTTEITAAATYALANKKLSAIAGKTTRLWNLGDDVAEAKGTPIALRDRAGLYESMVLSNQPMVVSEFREKLWTYDTTPTAYGIRSLSDANYYYHNSVVMPGAAGSFWVSIAFTIDAMSTSATRMLISTNAWDLRTLGTNGSMYFAMFDASSTFRASPVITFTTREIGKMIVVTGVYDAVAAKVRLYYRRGEVGTGSTTSGYLGASSGVMLGRWSNNTGLSASDVTVYGVAYGHGLPAASVVTMHHDAALAADGRLSAIAGMTAHLYDLTQDTSGGVVGATLTDRIGTSHLTRAGSPTTYARYSRTNTT